MEEPLMRRVRSRALIVGCLAVVQVGCCCVFSPGCKERLVTGTSVPEGMLRRVVPGKTTKWWLLRFIGKPHSIEQHPDGTEVLTYEYALKTEDRLSLHGADVRRAERVARTRLFFELRDDVVQRFWQTHGGGCARRTAS